MSENRNSLADLAAGKFGLASALARNFGLIDVQGNYYNGKVLAADGYRFNGCRFDRCTISVGSNNFEFVNCVFDETTQISFHDQAAQPIRLFLVKVPAEVQVKFNNFFWPLYQPDGTVSVVKRDPA